MRSRHRRRWRRHRWEFWRPKPKRIVVYGEWSINDARQPERLPSAPRGEEETKRWL